MTVQEFKEKFPHLSHLEGDALWDAMAMSVVSFPDKQPGDDEIGCVERVGDLTFRITKGAMRSLGKFKSDNPLFENAKFGFLIPK